jgi:two-component system, NtrC family, response regulator
MKREMGSLEMNQSRTVLLVDDEESLRRLLSRVVERGGSQVIAAANAREARRLFREHMSEIDVVLLDVIMPGGEGAAVLLPEFIAERPTLKVILTSGDALPVELEQELKRIGGQFLRKPFVPKALLRLLDLSADRISMPSAAVSGSVGPGGIS